MKVVGCVLVALLAVEAGMRVMQDSLSKDLAHIRSGGEIAERVAGASGPSLLLLGNSLTREGISPDLLRAEAGTGLSVEAYYPDGSSVNEWSYAYRRFFDYPGKQPDLLLIGFGRSHLFDADLSPERFGAYFCDVRDVGRYFRRHVHDLDGAARFLVARYSAAYAGRERVKPRVFSLLVPHYQEVLPVLTARPRPSDDAEPRQREFRNLEELLGEAREAGTRVAMVAIPMPDDYELPEAARRIIEDSGAVLVDARRLDGLDASDFPDDYHLGPDGAELLTSFVMKNLGPRWWSQVSDGD